MHVKITRMQLLHPNIVLNVEGEFTEEISVQHMIPYVITVTKKTITVLTPFIDTIGSDHTTSLTVKLKLLEESSLFKLDTGQRLQQYLKTLAHLALSLLDPSIHYGPSEQKLNVLVQLEGYLECKQQSRKQQFFVVRKLKINILDLPTVGELNLDATTDKCIH